MIFALRTDNIGLNSSLLRLFFTSSELIKIFLKRCVELFEQHVTIENLGDGETRTVVTDRLTRAG